MLIVISSWDPLTRTPDEEERWNLVLEILGCDSKLKKSRLWDTSLLAHYSFPLFYRVFT